MSEEQKGEGLTEYYCYVINYLGVHTNSLRFKEKEEQVQQSKYSLGQCVSFVPPSRFAAVIGAMYGKILSATYSEASQSHLYAILRPGYQEPVTVEEGGINRSLSKEETQALEKRLHT
jgi:hypothetical protein